MSLGRGQPEGGPLAAAAPALPAPLHALHACTPARLLTTDHTPLPSLLQAPAPAAAATALPAMRRVRRPVYVSDPQLGILVDAADLATPYRTWEPIGD